MSAVSLPLFSTRDTSADRVIRVAGLLTVAHLAAGIVPMASFARASGEWLPFGAHLLALVLGALVLSSRSAAFGSLRDWLPLALGPFLYIELRWLIAGVGRPHADALVQGWEHRSSPASPPPPGPPPFPCAG